MTALLALLKVAWPYMLAAALGGFVTGWLTHKADSIELERQKTAMASYKAEVSDAQATAEKAAREALQQQIDERHAADVNNAQVVDDLQKRLTEANSHYDADRAFIAGLLNASSKAPIPPGGGMPAAHDPVGTPAASGTSGSVEVAEQLCAETKAEDERNADKLDALIAAITPQLERKP